MKILTLDLPTMFGDHHVMEVRHLLLQLPGVTDVYASSGFQVVEVQYDGTKIGPDTIQAALEQAGYLGELPTLTEESHDEERNGRSSFFRRTTAVEQLPHTIRFAQQLPYAGRPLWPCPGFGVIEYIEEATHGQATPNTPGT